MARRSRPRIITKDRLDLEAFPEHVQVARRRRRRHCRYEVPAGWPQRIERPCLWGQKVSPQGYFTWSRPVQACA
jgi:hypothetical protein